MPGLRTRPSWDSTWLAPTPRLSERPEAPTAGCPDVRGRTRISSRDTRSLSLVALVACAVTVLAGCAGHSVISTGSDGLRTFTVVNRAILCDAGGFVPSVEGTLAGKDGARDPIWLDTSDGRHLDIVWPEGFRVRFEPEAVLYDDNDAAVARAGDRVQLPQVRPGAADGTYASPYVASGLVFGGCYPYTP